MPATPMSKAERDQGGARIFDLSQHSLRELNEALHKLAPGSNETAWEVLNPKGSHSVAVGVDQPVTIDVRGSVGYY
ncbi:protein GlxC, partial [Mesorhizobium sp. M2A.F.Ca.ET.037.01.1.1]